MPQFHSKQNLELVPLLDKFKREQQNTKETAVFDPKLCRHATSSCYHKRPKVSLHCSHCFKFCCSECSESNQKHLTQFTKKTAVTCKVCKDSVAKYGPEKFV